MRQRTRRGLCRFGIPSTPSAPANRPSSPCRCRCFGCLADYRTCQRRSCCVCLVCQLVVSLLVYSALLLLSLSPQAGCSCALALVRLLLCACSCALALVPNLDASSSSNFACTRVSRKHARECGALAHELKALANDHDAGDLAQEQVNATRDAVESSLLTVAPLANANAAPPLLHFPLSPSTSVSFPPSFPLLFHPAASRIPFSVTFPSMSSHD